jgi:nucleoid-associated protein YgaU
VGADAGDSALPPARPINITSVEVKSDSPFITGFVVNYDAQLSTLERTRINYIPSPDDRYHPVISSDSLSQLAFRYYGSSKPYWIIQDVNKLENAWELPVGQTLIIPDLIKLKIQLDGSIA